MGKETKMYLRQLVTHIGGWQTTVHRPNQVRLLLIHSSFVLGCFWATLAELNITMGPV